MLFQSFDFSWVVQFQDIDHFLLFCDSCVKTVPFPHDLSLCLWPIMFCSTLLLLFYICNNLVIRDKADFPDIFRVDTAIVFSHQLFLCLSLQGLFCFFVVNFWFAKGARCLLTQPVSDALCVEVVPWVTGQVSHSGVFCELFHANSAERVWFEDGRVVGDFRQALDLSNVLIGLFDFSFDTIIHIIQE